MQSYVFAIISPRAKLSGIDGDYFKTTGMKKKNCLLTIPLFAVDFNGHTADTK